ncbi:MAG: T9SS type A sorting domain-containing protein, partial [Calditrichaeota bacterium]|nr:T9SS type A sorting domain-containing protein [Calditrichota bacterium]
NPFNPSTVIRIAIPKLSRVSVQVYDILGQEVATIAHRDFEPGYHNLLWNCQTCAAGVYFVHMRAGEFVQTRKMLIVR